MTLKDIVNKLYPATRRCEEELIRLRDKTSAEVQEVGQILRLEEVEAVFFERFDAFHYFWYDKAKDGKPLTEHDYGLDITVDPKRVTVKYRGFLVREFETSGPYEKALRLVKEAEDNWEPPF